jgi:large repetitive protein
VEYSLKLYPVAVTARDLNGDGRPEIIVSGIFAVSVFENRSRPGTILLSAREDIGSSIQGVSIDAADLDGDGLLDIATSPTGNQLNVSVFRNLGGSGSLNLGPQQDIPAGNNLGRIALGDLDGDGRPDIAVDNLSLVRNNSSAGSISYQPPFTLYPGASASNLCIGDLDGDGRPDLLLNINGNNNWIFRNRTGSPDTINLCSETDTTFAAVITGSSYQWQQNSGSGFVNISDNAHLSGTATPTLRIISVPASWNGYEFRCLATGAGYSAVRHLSVAQQIVPAVTISADQTKVCSGTTVTFTASPLNPGSAPLYQWKRNGIPVGSGGITYNSSQFSNGDVVSLIMTSNALCAIPDTAASNAITLTVGLATAPTIRQSGDSLFSSSATGNQWYLNGVPIPGATGAAYKPTQSGGYNVQVTDYAGCTQSSNYLNFIVTAVVDLNGFEIGLKVAPNPSFGEFNLQFEVKIRDNLKIEVDNLFGQKVYERSYPGFAGRFDDQIKLGYLAAGSYILKISHNNRIYVRQLLIRR